MGINLVEKYLNKKVKVVNSFLSIDKELENKVFTVTTIIGENLNSPLFILSNGRIMLEKEISLVGEEEMIVVLTVVGKHIFTDELKDSFLFLYNHEILDDNSKGFFDLEIKPGQYNRFYIDQILDIKFHGGN